MRKLVNIFYGVCVLLLLEMPYGCQRMNSFETAAGLDQEGKSAQAILAYQDYLQNFPKTPLGSKICYRIAKNYEASSDFENALKWYEKILNEYPNTDENLHALLDMAALNQNKLKNNGKAVEYYQSALSRYREGDKIRDAVQFLVEAQYQSANVFFLLRDYKHAAQVAEAVYQSYPMEFLPPETRAKVDSLDDRAKRADQIALATSDAISIRQEKPFDKSYENDFPTAPNMEGKSIPSPDGKYLIVRKKASNGTYYLYLGKVPAKGNKVTIKIVKQTFGANIPSWSPDSSELVYLRLAHGRRNLEKINIKVLFPQTLYFSKGKTLGLFPVFSPSSNKIAYVYAGRVWLMNSDKTNKTLLKTSQKLDYTAELTWSFDGTMIRYRQKGKHGKMIDELLILDLLKSNLT